MSCTGFPKDIGPCDGGPFKGMPNKEDFEKLFYKNSWKAMDIANVAWYVNYDVANTELILRTASKLGLHYMDICQLIPRP